MSVKKRRTRTRLGAISAARCPRGGLRVRFNPNPVSLMLYSKPPPRGITGRVTTVPLGGGRRATCMKGPGGGLVYVQWDDGSFQGVSPIDLDKV